MTDIFQAAEKEKYDSPVHKANAIKSAMMQEFFSIQANVDLLTPHQKSSIEDYLKMTKLGKEEKAQAIFENVFEPALSMVKATKKAEELVRARNGYGNSNDMETNYKNKIMQLSGARYLRKGV
jgi:hypothetical protein